MINYQSFHYFHISILIYFFVIISNSPDFLQNTAEYNTYKYKNMLFIYFLLSVIDFLKIKFNTTLKQLPVLT